jgi:hypothetical protein
MFVTLSRVVVEKQSVFYILNVSLALVIEHARRMHRVILYCVVCLAILYLFTLCHKRYDFRKKFVDIKYAFWFTLKPCLKHLIPSRIQRDIAIKVHRS